MCTTSRKVPCYCYLRKESKQPRPHSMGASQSQSRSGRLTNQAEEIRGGSQSHSSSSRQPRPRNPARGEFPARSKMEITESSQSHRSSPRQPRPRKPREFGTPPKGIRKFSKKFSYIADQYNSLDQVQTALRDAGLESSNLILAIDFTKSNEWTGRHSFHGLSLHAIGDPADPNPYEQAISIIGQTLAVFDEDNLIPCFGFGDASTHDQKVFSFFGDNRPCQGFGEALDRYRQIVTNLKLSGPTSFAPAIEAAMRTVEQSGGQYHVLVIIADGQVTGGADTSFGALSSQEKATIDAIVTASYYPLSIVLVGVGDGPWDMMRKFDDSVVSRTFDNFQFVNFSEIMARSLPTAKKEALFALAALMEIPQQYRAIIELDLLGNTSGHLPSRAPLPPPQAVLQADHMNNIGHSSSSAHSTARPPATTHPPSKDPPSSSRSIDQSKRVNTSTGFSSELVCPVCLTERKDMVFGCGHQTCRGCAKILERCPICRKNITTRIRMY